jgi:hypothetical protein
LAHLLCFRIEESYLPCLLQQYFVPSAAHLVVGIDRYRFTRLNSSWVNVLKRMVTVVHHPDAIVTGIQTARPRADLDQGGLGDIG